MEYEDSHQATIGQKIETWVNQETGEIRQVQEIDFKTTDKGFEKVWIGMILSMLDIIGGKKKDVVSYLISKRSRTENNIFASQKRIADELKISIKTVTTTIQALKNANIVTQVTPGCYRINPAVIWRGSHLNRMAIMAKFSAEMASTASKTQNSSQATLSGVMMPQTGTED